MKSRILALPFARLGLVLSCMVYGAACSSEPGPDAGDGGGTDVVDANDVVAADATDASDASDASDATDTVDATEAGDAGPIVSFSAMVHVTMISQNCMPVIASDPMTLTGTVDIVNSGTAPIGPITATEGVIVGEAGTSAGMEIARFTIAPITIGTVAGGATGSTTFTKDANSLMPANACNTVMCSSPVRVEIPITGNNIPAGTRAISAISIVGCTM